MNVQVSIKTPECERMAAVREKSQAIGEFLEWLREEKGWTIAEEYGNSDRLLPVRYSTEALLAEFFGIDLNKVERERRAILEGCRSTRRIEDELKSGVGGRRK